MSNLLSNYLVEQILLGEAVSVNKLVVVYAGRFQPFHRGHFATYTHLVKKFGKDNVFIGTSNKTDNQKSPFNFKEKKEIMTTMFGIPSNKIVEIKNPYRPTEILEKFNEETTAFITVVGEKDEMRLGGNYFQKWNNKTELEGYRDKGYVYVSPAQPNAISGTDVRNNLGKNVDDNTKLDFFSKRAYPKFNKKIYDLITKKLSESYEPIHIKKEVIEEWVISKFPQFMNEVSQILGLPVGKDVDDGPNFFFPNYDVFEKISKERAEMLGMSVFKQIMDKKFEDYYEHPIYPNGPVGAVTFFPRGIKGEKTQTPSDDWFRHSTRAMALAGYTLVSDKNEIEKKLGITEGLGLAMGYPSKEQLKQKMDQLKKLRTQLDTHKTGDEKYTPIKEDKIEGGLSTGMDLTDIANHHKVDIDELMKEFQMGIKVEMEHTTDRKVAEEIAMDHLYEDPKYYSKLSTIEKNEYGFMTGKYKQPAAQIGGLGDSEYSEYVDEETLNENIIVNILIKAIASAGVVVVRAFLGMFIDRVINGAIRTYQDIKDIVAPEPYIKFLKGLEKNDTFNKQFIEFTIENRKGKNLLGNSWMEKITTLPAFVEEFDKFTKEEGIDGYDKTRLSAVIKKSMWDAYLRNWRGIYKTLKKKYPQFAKELPEGKLNEIPMADLVKIDQFVDKQLNPIDVVLTDKHFFERLTDPRNQKDISQAELIGFFKRLGKNKKKFLEFLDQYGQVVAKDNRTNINIPFMKQANRVIAKTIMRKDDFKTSSPTYKFEDIHEGSDIDGLGSGNNSPRWTASGQSKKLKFAQLSGYEQKDFPIADELDISGEGYGEVSVSTTAKYNNKKKAKRTADGQLVFENKIEHQFEANAVSGGKVHKFITGKNLTLKGKKYGDVHFELVSIDNKLQLVKLKVLAPKPIFGQELNVPFKTIRRGPFIKTDTNISEDINLPVKVGDTILTGKFKNKKTIVKTIGTDEHGMPTINGKKVATFRTVKEGYVESGEPETGYVPDGKVRIVGSDGGRPEPWYEQGGYSQLHFPKADAMRGKGRTKDKESSFRKVYYKTSNVKVSALKKALKPVGSDEWAEIPLNEGLLFEGGAYGHMNHPFDTEINLTFGQLKDIVNRALDGELELAREKTDGQALAISWVGGKLVAARNKGHLANKGANALDVKGVATKFAGRGELEKAYNFAMNDLEKAVKALSEKQREKIFKNGACFMNLEVIYPTSVNVIPYGQALLVFHGTMEYNEKGEAIGENQDAARILAGMIKQVNQNVQSTYTIQGPPVTKLPKSQKLSSLKGKYNGKVNKLQSQFKLSDNAGVAEYHQAWWTDFVQTKSPVAVDNNTLIGLVKRWAFYDKGFRLDNKNITDSKVLAWAQKIDKEDHTKIQKDNLRPFEDIFLGVGAEVLSFMSSVLAANPDAAVRNMKDRLDKMVSDVQKTGDVKLISKLKLELERLNSIGGTEKIVPNEGIVFVYNGNTMKLTGTFAPLNQILGMFYGK
jgi:nicotinic acid mononucleotide adenylyltransferase